MKESDDATESQKQKSIFSGITKNVFAMGLTSFLTDFSTELYYPLLPIFLKSVLGVGAKFIGLIEGIAETTASLLKLISGWISDRLNKRKALVVGGYGLSSLTRPLIALSTAGWHVLGARFLDRVGKGFRTAARDALIADSTHPSFRGKAFGFHRAMDHAGAAIGPLVAFIIFAVLIFGSGIFGDLIKHPIDTFTKMESVKIEERNAPIGEQVAPGVRQIKEKHFRTVFWIATIPAVLSFFVLIFLVKEVRGSSGASKLPILTLKPFDRYFKLFLPIVILFTLGNSSDAFLILRANDLGISPVFVPLLWIVLHIVKMVSSMPGGAWSDKVGRRKAIVAGWAVYSLIYLGFAFARSQWHIWILFALYGIYFGLTEGSEKAFVADLVPSELRATAYGVYNFAIGIAAFPASLIMGLLYDTFNATIAFSFGAALSLVAMILLLIAIPAKVAQKKV